MLFSELHSVYKCTHPCTKTDRQTHSATCLCMCHTGVQHKCTKQASTTKLSKTQSFLWQKTLLLSCLVHCDEFTQFTGITFGKVKGRLEVTVSSLVSGWPLRRGGGDHSHRWIVCCCASRKPELNGKHEKYFNDISIIYGDKSLITRLNLRSSNVLTDLHLVFIAFYGTKWKT